MLGQLEREDVAVPRNELAWRLERRGDLLLALATLHRKTDLQQQQLVERQPPPPGFRLVERARPVQGPERVGPRRKVLLHPRRQRVGDRTRERRGHELAHLLRRQLLAGGIDRRIVRSRLAVADIEAADVEAVAALSPAEPHRRPRLQLPLQPRLVEPRRGDGRAPVRDARREHLQAPAPPLRHGEHLAADRDLVVAPQLSDAELLHRQLVAERPVLEQVPDRREPEPLELPLQRRPDARERLDGARERVSAREQSRPRPRRRFLASEPDGHSVSSNQKKPTVPGPACVPTTAPSVVTTSMSACGRSAWTIFSS